MQWQFLSPIVPQNLNEVKELLCANRNLGNQKEQKSFFNPIHPDKLSVKELGFDPKMIKAAGQRVLLALKKKEKIVIFGDYDADGICATAVLWQVLHGLGLDVTPFIPDRRRHGYGLAVGTLKEVIAEHQPSLIITVDNGIVAFAAAEYLQEQKIDLIITDHHVPEDRLPMAKAVIHTTKLCGATVTWMFGRELLKFLKRRPLVTEAKKILTASLDLAAIATVADQVPLTGGNRSFAWHGIRALQTSKRPGLLSLVESSDIEQKNIGVNEVNYTLAPRLNAMGRLEHGLDALRLLCTNSRAKAHELAMRLNLTNIRRQDLTNELLELALQQADEQGERSILIVQAPEFHEGVIGLIAGRLVEQYYKPAIVMSVGETTIKASARSVPGVNIIELIRLVKDDLFEAGGHPMAAWFGLELTKIELVKNRLYNYAAEQITVDMLQERLEIECSLPAKALTLELVELLTMFEPFGQGNHKPIFALPDMVVVDTWTMGTDDKHLKLVVKADDEPAGQAIQCIGWGMGELATRLKPGMSLAVAGTVEVNEWKGRQSLQVMVKDVSV